MRPVAAESLVLGACLALTACAGIPARGVVGGQTIDSRVDSEAARYYLENYLAGKRGNPALDERIDIAYHSSNGLPDRGELKRLSEDFSLDFAALYFADRLARVPENRRFRGAFDRARSHARKAFPDVKLPAGAAAYEVLFVPGYLYKRLPLLGTNFAAPRAALKKAGLANSFVETKEDGAVEANADLVAAAIRSRAQSGRRLILVSASKSGSEVALALTKLAPGECRHVAAWINAVGALQGTPLADERALAEVDELRAPVDSAGMESMTTERSRKRFAKFRVPQEVLVVNYIGVPVTGSVSSLGGRGFYYMKKFGPSDGITLLPDALFPGGVTLVELGRDHFLLDAEIGVTTVAMVSTLILWLEENGGKVSPGP